MPRHVLTAAASIDLPWEIATHAHYHRAWGGWLDDANVYSIHGPSTVDLRIQRPAGRQTVFVDILNAFGNVYEEYGFTLKDSMGGAVPFAYPSSPREVRAGVTIAF